MKKLKLHSGVESYQLGEFGVVRFDPADPGLFRRFFEAQEKVKTIQQTLDSKLAAAADPVAVLTVLEQADGSVKELLGWVFGNDNDFRQLFRDTNLLAPGPEGRSMLEQVMEALLQPVREGMARWADTQVAQAKASAQQRRAAQ